MPPSLLSPPDRSRCRQHNAARVAPLLLACLALAACNDRPIAAQAHPADPAAVGSGRPVATLGPDDGVRAGVDALDLSRNDVADDAPSRAPAPSLEPVSARQMKQAIDSGGKIALQVEFDADRATLRADADPLVEQIATLLHDEPGLRLSIEGHTDASGDPGQNRALSRQRAETVRAALIVKGIDASRLLAQGFGADRPIARDDSAEGGPGNRRVELVRID